MPSQNGVGIMKQRQIASRVLKCGTSRVWIDPSRIADVSDAITAADIRRFIKDGVIRKLPKQGTSNFRLKKLAIQKKKGRRKGHGSRKGYRQRSASGLAAWTSRIRALRSELRQLRDAGRIEKKAYRVMYKKSKSGFFRSRAHLRSYLEKEGMMKGA